MPRPSTSVQSAIFLRCLAVFITFARPSSAGHFLGPVRGGPAPGSVSADLGGALLSEIEVVLGSEHRSFTEKRLGRIEESLRATYAAVPKNEHGRLGHSAASYVLHRFFLQRHAWSVLGLDPAGESMTAWNASAIVGSSRGGVPDHILRIFEERLGSHGLGRRELAILAATIEHLVHKEAIERLRIAYETHGYTSEHVLDDGEVQTVMEAYMSYYILSAVVEDASDAMPAKMRKARAMVDEIYPSWNLTKRFVREVTEGVAHSRDHMYFADVSRVVEEVGDRFGQWQDHECRSLKDLLVAFEDKGPMGAGRVRLADFYRKVLYEDEWRLGETVDSLQKMGAIDDTDPANLRVIIPNYISSPGNCLSGSSYYSICCIDECEKLLVDLEDRFATPDLAVDEIAVHVAAMPSATAPGNRTLSASLLRRLDEVAAHHGGRVPIHGRLFAQWMHHAYPRECRYPHVSGTTDPMQTRVTSDNFESSSASVEEMQQYVDAARDRGGAGENATLFEDAEDACAMWTMEEELVGWRAPAQAPERAGGLAGRLRGGVAVGALVLALAAVRLRSRGSDASAGILDAPQKQYV